MIHYCGTSTLPKWLNKFLSFFHNEACRRHDYQYESKTKRIIADLNFLRNMLWNGLKNLLMGTCQMFLAPIMFLAVLFFGFIFYRKGPY